MVDLKEPKDIRELIRTWIAEACEKKRLPFGKDGGTIVQLLNAWLRSYETDKMAEMKVIAGLGSFPIRSEFESRHQR
jgi:hypothetical protein